MGKVLQVTIYLLIQALRVVLATYIQQRTQYHKKEPMWPWHQKPKCQLRRNYDGPYKKQLL